MRSDAQTRESVLSALRWDRRCAGSNIRVAVEDGIVTLSGDARTPEQRAAAQAAALRAVGVIDLANNIFLAVDRNEVEPSRPQD